MSEALTIENFAAELAAADKPEQPETDSGAEAQIDGEEGPADPVESTESEAQAEEEVESDPQEQPEEDSQRVIEWKTASGETYKATEDELKAGYLRQQDYTHKAQAVAEERKQAQATFTQQVQIVQSLASEIGEFQAAQAEVARYAQVDWRAWSAADPAAASSAYIEFQQLKEKANAAGQNVRSAREALERQQSQALIDGVQASEKHLAEKVKGVTRAEVERMFGTMQKIGADQKVLDSVRSNPALAEMAIYAQRWVELQEKKPQVDNKVKALPPATVKSRPAAVKNKGEEVARLIQSRKAFSVDDFAKLLKATR